MPAAAGAIAASDAAPSAVRRPDVERSGAERFFSSPGFPKGRNPLARFSALFPRGKRASRRSAKPSERIIVWQDLARANHVIHISISSHIKGSSYAAAQEAARSFDHVTVVDSGHLSSGEGLLALEACRMVREGLEPEQIVRALEDRRALVHTSFIVDSLEYLERAGLVGHRVAKLSKALMLRPVLRLRDGEIRIGRVYLGSRETAWRKYFAAQLSAMAAADRRRLFVTYVGLSQKELAALRAEIDRRGGFETVYLQKASPAIAVNCGPGTFGLLFLDAAEGQ